MKNLFLALFLLTGLASCGGAKGNDPQPLAPAPAPTPALAATGTYTDAAGVVVALSALSVKVSKAAAQPTTGALRQGIDLTAALPDGRLIRVGYLVAQGALPAVPGPLPLDEMPYIAGPYAAVDAPLNGPGSKNGYASKEQSNGSLSLSAVGPALASGRFAGPLLPAAGHYGPNLPVVKVFFSNVPVQ